MTNPENCKNIEEIREAIDGIDYQIMELYSKRYEFVKAIVKFKSDEASVVAKERQKEVIEKRREWAIKLGLNPDFIEEIYWKLMNSNVQKELEILNTKQNHV